MLKHYEYNGQMYPGDSQGIFTAKDRLLRVRQPELTACEKHEVAGGSTSGNLCSHQVNGRLLFFFPLSHWGAKSVQKDGYVAVASDFIDGSTDPVKGWYKADKTGRWLMLPR